MDVAKAIILKGEVQLTAQQRKEMLESKRKRVVAEIHSKCHQSSDQRTASTVQSIETAMEEAKVHIDPFKSVESQIKPTS